jgi:hypothetical protein
VEVVGQLTAPLYVIAIVPSSPDVSAVPAVTAADSIAVATVTAALPLPPLESVAVTVQLPSVAPVTVVVAVPALEVVAVAGDTVHTEAELDVKATESPLTGPEALVTVAVKVSVVEGAMVEVAGVTATAFVTTVTVALPLPPMVSLAVTVQLPSVAPVTVVVAVPALEVVAGEVTVHTVSLDAKLTESPLTVPPVAFVTVAVKVSAALSPMVEVAGVTAMVLATTAVPWPIVIDAEPPSTVDTEMVQNSLAALAV